MNIAYFESENEYVVKITSSKEMISKLANNIFPLFRQVNVKPENLSIKVLENDVDRQAAIERYFLDRVDWREYGEGFTETIRIKENNIENQIALLHQSGDVIVHNKKEVVLYSDNALSVRYIMLDCYSRWMQSQGAVPMHASAVKYQDNGIMICGHKMAGKTTLTFNFLNFEEFSFIDNDKVLWLGENIYCGNPSLNVFDELSGQKIKSRGMEVFDRLPNKAKWSLSAKLKYIIILRSGANCIDIRNAGEEKINLLNEYIHDPWCNWLKIFPDPVHKLNIPNNVEVLVCDHGIRDEFQTCELLFKRIAQ